MSVAITVENGMPVVIRTLEDENAFMAYLVPGFDKTTGAPIYVPMYRRVFTVNGGEPFFGVEVCMN